MAASASSAGGAPAAMRCWTGVRPIGRPTARRRDVNRGFNPVEAGCMARRRVTAMSENDSLVEEARESRLRVARHLAELHRLHLALAEDSRSLKRFTQAGRP